MKVKNLFIGLVVITIVSMGFYYAFGLPTKYYIPEDDIQDLEDLGRSYVEEANPSFLGQLLFYIGALWDMVKLTFSFILVGTTAMLFDMGAMVGFPPAMTIMMVGLIIYIIALQVLENLKGGN